MDITASLAPASEQLDAIELIGGPRVFEIERVTVDTSEQPVNVFFKDFPRPWRPSKNMRRVLAGCWTADARTWTGHRVELFFDPEVTFGKDKPGGTRISKLSHIDGPKRIPLLVSRGKSAMFTVQPLADAPPPPPQAPDLAPMFALLTDAGLGDKEAALAFIGDKIGRTVATTKELTRDETATVVRALEAILVPPPPADASDPDAPMLGDPS